MYQRQLNFGEAINIVVGQKYCDFSGRASRSEYWWFCLLMAIISFGIGFISGIITGVSGSGTFGRILQGIVSLAFLLPSLGVAVRRLHDINKSGWWLLLGLIPVVGAIILIVWYCQPSDPRPNAYGEEPYMQY